MNLSETLKLMLIVSKKSYKSRNERKQLRSLNNDLPRIIEKVEELELQINKMKNCANCKNEMSADEFIENCYVHNGFCGSCRNYDKWEIKQ